MRNKDRYRVIAQVCALSTAGIGFIAIIGWLTNLWMLHSIRADYIPMAPSTALAFVIMSGSLFVSTRWDSRHLATLFSKASAVLVAVFALLMLIQFFLGTDFGIEKMLAGESGTLRGFPIGRMSPVTASAFFLSGLSQLFLLCVPQAPKSGRYLVVVMAVGVLMIGLAILTSYLFEAPLLYRGAVIPVALPTAIAFVLLGSGLFAAVMPYLSLSISVGDALILTMPVFHGRYLPSVVMGITGVLLSITTYGIIHKNRSFESALFVLSAGLLFTALLTLYLLTTEKYSIALKKSLDETHDREREILTLAETLEINENRFRSVAETAYEAIVSADSNGNVIFWNKSAELMFGYSAQDTTGRPLTIIIPEQFRKAHIEGMKRVVTGGEQRLLGKTVELQGLKKDGSEFPLELSLASWNSKEEMFFTAIIRDISERKRTEAERDKLIAELQDALARIKTLRGFVPICSYCKKIRNDQNYWEHLEAYISEHSEAEFTHSICPECAEKAMAEISQMKKDKEKIEET